MQSSKANGNSSGQGLRVSGFSDGHSSVGSTTRLIEVPGGNPPLIREIQHTMDQILEEREQLLNIFLAIDTYPHLLDLLNSVLRELVKFPTLLLFSPLPDALFSGPDFLVQPFLGSFSPLDLVMNSREEAARAERT